MKFVGKSAVLALATGVSMMGAGQASALDEITVAYFLEWPMPFQYARQMGTYEEELGVAINWRAFDTGTAMSAAMASGDVHISVSQGVPPFVVAASAGTHHSLAITADGSVWSWGSGGFGKLGHGDEQNQLLPKKVEALPDRRVVAVSAGEYHSLALTADGAVWSWGDGLRGKLGHGDQQDQQDQPKKVEALAGQRVVAVSAGKNHSLALTADGSPWSWGVGLFGQLGHGDGQNQPLPKKIEAVAGQRVVAESAGAWHSLAVTAENAVFAWGEGETGCLGHGEDLSNQLLPKKVEARRALAIQTAARSTKRTPHGCSQVGFDRPRLGGRVVPAADAFCSPLGWGQHPKTAPGGIQHCQPASSSSSRAVL